MDRRDFLKKTLLTGAITGAGMILNRENSLFGENNTNKAFPDLVALKGGEPDAMFDRGIEAIGGIGRFVKSGQTVVIKPNIGWNQTPEIGATTNPALVKRIIEHCFNAGAKKVYVFDHSCDYETACYKNSGIEKAAAEAGAQVVPANAETYYHEVEIPKAKKLKKVKIHELILESDVFINVPVLKNHSATQLTISMKNLMGTVWDMGYYHGNNLSQCIADYCIFKKPDLNIVDAYRVMTQNGPRGISSADSIKMKSMIISTDIVAADSASAKLYGTSPDNISYIKFGNDAGVGTMNLNGLNIKKINI